MAQATRAELEQRIEEQDQRITEQDQRITRLEGKLTTTAFERNLWQSRCREILTWAM